MTTIYSPINLTSNTSNGFLVPSASSSSSDAWSAFNSSTSDYWSPSTSAASEFLQIDLGTSEAISLVRVLCDTSVATPTQITIAGSANGTTFTNITAFTGLSFSAGVFTDLVVVLPANTLYRHYRLILVNQNGVQSRLISVEFARSSQSNYSKSPINPCLVKQVNSIVKVPRWDPLLEGRIPKSVSNYSKVVLNQSQVLSRPVQGQLFPRGYPIKSQTVTVLPVEEINLLNSSLISLKQITGFGGATPYASNLTAACTSQYQPTGSFCNIIYPNDKNVIWKHIPEATVAWNNPGTVGTGVLVLDLLSSKIFNRLNIFQVFADGKITHIQIYSHPSTSSTFPVNTDAGWVPIGSEIAVGAGAMGFGGYTGTPSAVISSPTIFDFASVTSRYLKIHARNTGSLGFPTYIEIGGLKLFNV